MIVDDLRHGRGHTTDDTSVAVRRVQWAKSVIRLALVPCRLQPAAGGCGLFRGPLLEDLSGRFFGHSAAIEIPLVVIFFRVS